ncbi:MAG: 2,3,4,5-tetrahydropyridine-2,6-dicarboxylate N-succinyltransferase [candidate division KSB1 bacterium]|nr:2,3,4,5-tetrahydropyridine-2,6-dicarboxylate N-succinyltransferase [candidate division KSB1 bacterium]MDZ7367131.1 2,3,4,5-tetrahydropyridine-2,6-dicarboxylate N-succinyltransferase [candidate division KSB1 bacterium]MDZ7405109.1 2,3,4,5-tetrahydropyridine-2,6-dicarboxylate N-succinyltransferase [candidate division KSB1 bacterium]
MQLQPQIESLFAQPPQEKYGEEYFAAFNALKAELNAGRVRAAEKSGNAWRVNLWVKKGILLGFRIGALQDMSINENFRFYDKSTYPLKAIAINDGVRLVPGGSSIRDGCYLGRGVTCMPPMYVNAGAYIDDGTMIDSHALVGSCAQIGKRVHLSAGAQIGGVLEPVGSLPVIIEDDVLIGGNCGIYEGTIVRQGAVIGAGVILTGSTPVYDLAKDQIYRKTAEQPLEIPANAVVVPGTRPFTQGRGHELGLAIYAPIIVKYRDEKTDLATQLEEALR